MGSSRRIPNFAIFVLSIQILAMFPWGYGGASQNHTSSSSSSSSPSSSSSNWLPATGIWYGNRDGDGTDGGACGYGQLSSSAYGSIVSAGSPDLFKNGLGCGACYQVKCGGNSACAESAVKVVITDQGPSGNYPFGYTHFDLSGSAFSSMALVGFSTSLLNAGILQLYYKRVACEYPSTNIEFYVNEGATDYWFSILVKYVAGEGEISNVELMQGGNGGNWESMHEVWGAYWCLNAGPLHGPFSLRLTSAVSGQVVTADHVIPQDWNPGSSYKSTVNFL